MRRRIVFLVVAMTTLVVLAFAIPLAVLIRHNVYRDAIKALQDNAASIGYELRTPGADLTASQISTYLASRASDARDVSVQLPSGQIVGSVPGGGFAGAPALPNTDGDHGHGGPGGFDGGPDGPAQLTHSWRGGQLSQLPVGTPGGQYVVRVYASDDQLHSGETGWWVLLAVTSAGLLVIGVVAAELLTRRIVRPLLRTAATAQHLAAGDVSARAPTDGPREIAEVGVALNSLADRIDELIAEERETVADVSHRLRTPLTALRLDAEALHDPADADRIGAHVGTLERMLTAVIHAARRPQREGRMPACDATAVIGERVAFWSALTDDQGRVGAISLPSEPLPVRAAAEDLAAAVDALLENVIAHTPEGTAFSVTLAVVPTASSSLSATTGLACPTTLRCAAAPIAVRRVWASTSRGGVPRRRAGRSRSGRARRAAPR